MDNTRGVVTISEIARVLAPYIQYFQRTLRFIAFTGEERGYAGSKYYVRAHADADELDCTCFVFSMDCLFPGTAQVERLPAVHAGRSTRRASRRASRRLAQ
jgi:Zn-dependent M28 family amino/carboxypeptidase